MNIYLTSSLFDELYSICGVTRLEDGAKKRRSRVQEKVVLLESKRQKQLTFYCMESLFLLLESVFYCMENVILP